LVLQKTKNGVVQTAKKMGDFWGCEMLKLARKKSVKIFEFYVLNSK